MAEGGSGQDGQAGCWRQWRRRQHGAVMIGISPHPLHP